MPYNILITGADRGLGASMCKQLLEMGHTVFAGQFMPEWKDLENLKSLYSNNIFLIQLDVGSLESVEKAKEMVNKITPTLDVLINNAAFFSDKHNYKDMQLMYNVNSLGPIRVTETFLPLLEKGNLKRLCYLSSEASSITESKRDSWFGYSMSKTSLNMATKILFNGLRPKGYTFRLHHPGYLKTYMNGFLNTDGKFTADEAAQMALDIFLTKKENEDELRLIDYDKNTWEW
ncbi:MAG: SDR family NAD(P)-dependent oxidoreductase [Spirochaetaceae bacterium]